MRLVEGVIDFGSADENHVDGVSGIYRVSQNTVCIELYANKIVDGKVQKVVVMRNTWDRACWLDMQSMIARIFLTYPSPPPTTKCASTRRPILKFESYHAALSSLYVHV
jgi:hypothetical protein